ncbi:stage II sporulation protein M [Methanobacterium sp. ACI-7]|uniref:stage II sporulation protein M n=1 Tax=unclassified Methanobacterium TaxID=2627676 RepID=UPI0039C21AE5
MLKGNSGQYDNRHQFDGFFMGLYRRNELLLIISAAVFLGSLFAGYFLSSFIDPIMANVFNSFRDRVGRGEIKLTTISIFANNLQIAFSLYAGGIIVGLITIWILVFNGIFIGYAASKFPIGDFIIYTIPHGIFELTGIIIAGAAGLRLASTVIHIINDARKIKRYMSIPDQFINVLNANYFEFKESLALLIIAAILIFIGAVIEANFTISWANYIKGFI